MHIWLHLGREEKGVRTRVCVSELNTRDRLGILHPSTREDQNLFIPVQEWHFLKINVTPRDLVSVGLKWSQRIWV